MIDYFIQKIREFKTQVGNRVLTTLALTAILIIATIFITDRWLSDITHANQTIISNYRKMSTLNEIRTLAERMEASQRGYLLSNQSDYLAPYTQSKALIQTQLTTLQQLLNDSPSSPSELENTAELNRAIAAKTNEMDMTLALAQNGQNEHARALIDTQQGLQLQNKIRTHSQTLYQQMSAHLTELVAQRSQKITWARWSILLTILLLSAVILSTLNSLIKVALQKDAIQQQLAQENKNYQRRLDENLRLMQGLVLDAQTEIEDSRAQLARDLHDELGSILTAIRMDLSWAIKRTQSDLPPVAEKLLRTQNYLDRAITFKRQVVDDLHPSTLDNFGLWVALENMAHESAQRNQWQMDLQLPEDEITLPKSLQLVVYRVIQETLNNASKYAQAQHFTLDISHDDQHLKVDMRDDGVGMDLSQKPFNTHGLNGMKNRIFATGGDIHFHSQPGKGMHTQILLPLKPPSAHATLSDV